MPADRLDLAARIAATTRSETVAGRAINAAFDVARARADEATARLCDPTGMGRRNDLGDYPVSDALTVLWAVADRLERSVGGTEAAFEAVGRRAAECYLGTLRGRALALLHRNPRALLARLEVPYGALLHFGERYLAWPAERRCRIELDHDYFPLAWHRGLVGGLLEAARASGPSVEGRVPGFARVLMDVGWG